MDERELDELLGEHATRHRIPGATIGVQRDGATACAYHGVADVSSGELVTAETRFSVGSLVKSMVATVVMRLAEVGRLSLDDMVAAHVPELGTARWAGEATVRDLLANRSGLPLCTALEFEPPNDADDDVLSRLAARVAVETPASSVWSYTNVGWCLLGRVIETATGRVWEQAMRTHLLGPAGMAQTVFCPAAVPRVVGHTVSNRDAESLAPWEPRTLGPAGSTLVSTAADMLKFAAMHLADSALQSMRESGTETRIHGWFDTWCHGWARFDWGGRSVWGWDGLIGGERSFLRLFPDENAAVVLMTNGSAGRAMYRSLFADLFGMPPLQLQPSAGVAGDLDRFAGTYAWPDRRAEVRATPTSLVIEADETTFEALPIDERTFLVDPADPDNPTVTFGAFDEGGVPGAVYLMIWALPRI